MAGEISTGEIYGRCHFLKEWLFWDVSIHAGQAQIERQGRAMTYPFSFKINRSAQAGTFSSTSDLPFYSTTCPNVIAMTSRTGISHASICTGLLSNSE